MSEDTPAAWDTDKVKLIGIGHDQTILNHVPAWYGEACGQGKIKKVKRQGVKQNEGWCLEVTTPTKADYCKVGDVIKNSPLDALFVRHFNHEEKETT